ncbi:MAG: type IA DNA topoisomerase [Eubacterium sp.]|nr:type IA DNA topoisomerase [Eubacterium sp.]MCI8919507.1 type IA DNA topoisomerase [Eubacterium sp.]
MPKALYIAEKPSVAQEFSKALKMNMKRHDGYQEGDQAVVTWCVGHLVTMSYPEAYDEKYKKWSLATLPFIPQEFKYEIIPGVSKQFKIVSSLLNRRDIDTIYVCTDSGREGEYIYRLVEQLAGVRGKKRKRVWIDSQTEDEILRGIREAKDLSEYDNLASSAYLRAKEDYLMGINFSRLLTLKYGTAVADYLNEKYAVISVGRVMTCVLGMVVRREREIRDFVKTPFYRVMSKLDSHGHKIESEWKAVEGSAYFQSPKLYKENGFKEKKDAESLTAHLEENPPVLAELVSLEKKKETKNAPLLFNLAELQNTCSRFFKISPDQTLGIVQELYEKKLVTYPRTDARVLSTAAAKEIRKNISGLCKIPGVQGFAQEILDKESYRSIAKSRYTNDKQITDHYAVIPTGQGLGAMKTLSSTAVKVYETIVRRFLAIFYPPAIYLKYSMTFQIKEEKFFAGFKVLKDQGYLQVMNYSFFKKKDTSDQENPAIKKEAFSEEKGLAGKNHKQTKDAVPDAEADGLENGGEDSEAGLLQAAASLKKGDKLPVDQFWIKEGETSPPKRYNSGSMILAMENAGQLIEDEELRATIKGSGIGTSATRAEILAKLVKNKYLALNKKTQVITPTLLGEMIFDVVNASIRQLLNPELTASWEKGLTYVAEGSITTQEYMVKLEQFIKSRTSGVMNLNNRHMLRGFFDQAGAYYKTK